MFSRWTNLTGLLVAHHLDPEAQSGRVASLRLTDGEDNEFIVGRRSRVS